MNVSPIIKYRTLAIAKSLAPVDTGNLRHNAIKLIKSNGNSWGIKYDTQQANYIEPLQEGSKIKGSQKRNDRHKGFIDLTVAVLSTYVYGELTGRNQNTNRYLRGALSTAENNPQRELRNARSVLGYTKYKELSKNYKSVNKTYNL